MRKSSWVLLGICFVLLLGLGGAYLLSLPTSNNLTQKQAEEMIHKMQLAVEKKDVGAIMNYISPSPETKIDNVNKDQIRLMLAHAFRAMEHPRADVQNLTFSGGTGSDAILNFDLAVRQSAADFQVDNDFKGHLIVQLKRMEISHMMGLYHTTEWRITGVTGPDLSIFGDYN